MIVIFFSTGMFGSTIEFVLRSATNEYSPLEEKILSDGSMHSFEKMHHLTNDANTAKFLNSQDKFNDKAILTPTYPSENNRQLSEVWTSIESVVKTTDKLLLIYANSTEYAEINVLFTVHKLLPRVDADEFYRGIDIKQIVTAWNTSYNSLSDMQRWEFREWQSLLNFRHITDAYHQLDNRFLKISTQEILDNTYESFEKIISWCGLTRNTMNLKAFADQWRQSQQYVLDEYQLILELVDATINNVNMPIPNNLSVWAEAIVQRRLRNAGYEIRCHGLNNFPDNTIMLHELLYQSDSHIGQTL